VVNIDILLIQETMVNAHKAREMFAKLLPSWHFRGVDSIGLLGGLLSAWNLRRVDFNSFLTHAGILLEGLVKYINKRVKLVNCYDPYADRQAFWGRINKYGFLNEHSLIIGGDLNFTTSNREVWGMHARSSPLQSYFRQMIQDARLVDVEPVKILPT